MGIPSKIVLQKFIFVNLALSIGIHVIQLRQSEVTDVDYYDVLHYDDDVTVDDGQLEYALQKALQLLDENHNNIKKEDFIPTYLIYPDLYL